MAIQMLQRILDILIFLIKFLLSAKHVNNNTHCDIGKIYLMN